MRLNILVIDDELARIDYRREEFLTRWNLFPESGAANSAAHPLQFTFISSQRVDDDRIENDADLAVDFIKDNTEIDSQNWALVLLDMQFDHGTLLHGEPIEADTQFGLKIHARLEAQFPTLPIVHFTALPQTDLARQDSHYLSKLDGSLDDLRLTLVEIGRSSLQAKQHLLRLPKDTIATSDASIRLYAEVYRRARADTPLLIRGSTGTGKEHLSRYFHLVSPHADGDFVAIQISTVPTELYESELFGHEKGAFTGANTAHDGVFSRAGNGTLFLDEIGALPESLQAKLLRAIGERVFRKVGSSSDLKLNCGIVAATQDDLENSGFRQDLLARFGSVTIPPLSERRDEILPLAQHFLGLVQNRDNKRGIVFSPEAEKFLATADFPDNARGIRQVIEKAVLKLSSNSVVQPRHFGEKQPTQSSTDSGSNASAKLTADQSLTLALESKLSNLSEVIQALAICTVPNATDDIRNLLTQFDLSAERIRQEIAFAALHACRHPVSGKIRVLPAIQLVTGNAGMTPVQAKRKLNQILGHQQRDPISTQQLETELAQRFGASKELEQEQTVANDVSHGRPI